MIMQIPCATEQFREGVFFGGLPPSFFGVTFNNLASLRLAQCALVLSVDGTA